MASCKDCLHYKPCKDWAIDCFHSNSIFPYEAESAKDLCEYYTPTADVVQKSEVESYKQIAENQRKLSMDRFFEVKRLKEDIERLVQENETLKDNDEHLAVMLEEKEIELKAMRGAANSLKVHYENAKTELASEIFAEIEKVTSKDFTKKSQDFEFGYKIAIQEIIAELKKKYPEVNNDLQ